MANKEPYKLPDRPRRTTRPTEEELRARLEKAGTRVARIQAGRDGKN